MYVSIYLTNIVEHNEHFVLTYKYWKFGISDEQLEQSSVNEMQS